MSADPPDGESSPEGLEGLPYGARLDARPDLDRCPDCPHALDVGWKIALINGTPVMEKSLKEIRAMLFERRVWRSENSNDTEATPALPEGWSQSTDDDGAVFYIDLDGARQEALPNDFEAAEEAPVPMLRGTSAEDWPLVVTFKPPHHADGNYKGKTGSIEAKQEILAEGGLADEVYDLVCAVDGNQLGMTYEELVAACENDFGLFQGIDFDTDGTIDRKEWRDFLLEPTKDGQAWKRRLETMKKDLSQVQATERWSQILMEAAAVFSMVAMAEDADCVQVCRFCNAFVDV